MVTAPWEGMQLKRWRIRCSGFYVYELSPLYYKPSMNIHIEAFARTWYRFFDRNARNAGASEEAERPVGADMTRQHPRMGIHWCAHCLRPRPHARPVDVNPPDVLAFGFLIRQRTNLGPVRDRALDCSSSRLAHALGRPTTALRPACPRVARTCRASALPAPAFRRNREISA